MIFQSYVSMLEMAALEGQRLVAEFFLDSRSELDFEGFHASVRAENLSGRDDSGSVAVTESDDDEGVTGRMSDAAAAAAYRTNPNLPDYGSSVWPADPCVRLLCIFLIRIP